MLVNTSRFGRSEDVVLTVITRKRFTDKMENNIKHGRVLMRWSWVIKVQLFMLLVFSMGLYAKEDLKSERIKKLQETVDKIMSKAGIHFGGEFRSQFMNSTINGEASTDSMRRSETVEYTSVDFDIQARPNTMVQARALIRLHQGWRNFFSDVGNPINTRWLSIDGRILNNTCAYNLGYFKKKYTPLTMYSPDIEIDYEPEIFAFSRKKAMEEVFLGDNNRVHQGLSYDVDIGVKPIFEEVHLNVLGARLRMSETSMQNGNFQSLDTVNMDKYAIGSNLDLVFIPDMSLGASFVDIFDWKKTSNEDNEITADILETDTTAQKTAIIDFRGVVGTAAFLDPNKVNFTFGAEFAFSNNDSSFVTVDSINDTLNDTTLNSETIKGKALALNLDGFIGIGDAGNARLHFGFRRNDELYRNEMAQTPSFIPNRIMNTENDMGDGTLYTTFDAIYRDVYKFCASGQNGYERMPMRKISYGNAVLTQRELARLALDPVLQLSMPFGPATPNRSGIEGDFSVNFFENGLRASVSVLSMNELKEGDSVTIYPDSINGLTDTLTYLPPLTSFFELGFGASIDLASFIDAMERPLRFSGGYKMSKAANDGDGTNAFTEGEVNVGFINAGFYWNFWKRASLLAGLQRITMTTDSDYDKDVYTCIQNQWAAGLEYKVKEGGTVTGTIGQIKSSQECDNPDINLSNTEFDQLQIDLYLSVNF